MKYLLIVVLLVACSEEQGEYGVTTIDAMSCSCSCINPDGPTEEHTLTSDEEFECDPVCSRRCGDKESISHTNTGSLTGGLIDEFDIYFDSVSVSSVSYSGLILIEYLDGGAASLRIVTDSETGIVGEVSRYSGFETLPGITGGTANIVDDNESVSGSFKIEFYGGNNISGEFSTFIDT